MADVLSRSAVNAAECILEIERRRPRRVSPQDVRDVVGYCHQAGLTESAAWDVWIQWVTDAQWCDDINEDSK